MKQYLQVIDVMRKNGGCATLGFLYRNVDVSNWGTKTPFASIRRIVQDKRYFFKIQPGLWALNEQKEDILKRFDLKESDKKTKEFNHTYYQGLLIEIGSLKGFITYVPPQDKNKLFLGKPLGKISSINSIFNFTYEEIVNRAKSIDVIWFNDRKLPDSFFEIEYSTDMQNSLLKFIDLRDFHSRFFIISALERKKEYEKKISYSAFNEIQNRVKFIDYDYLSNLHAKSVELSLIGML